MDHAGQGNGFIIFLDRSGKKVVQMPKAQELQISTMAKSLLCGFLKIGARAQTWRDLLTWWISCGRRTKKNEEIMIDQDKLKNVWKVLVMDSNIKTNQFNPERKVTWRLPSSSPSVWLYTGNISVFLPGARMISDPCQANWLCSICEETRHMTSCSKAVRQIGHYIIYFSEAVTWF